MGVCYCTAFEQVGFYLKFGSFSRSVSSVERDTTHLQKCQQKLTFYEIPLTLFFLGRCKPTLA